MKSAPLPHISSYMKSWFTDKGSRGKITTTFLLKMNLWPQTSQHKIGVLFRFIGCPRGPSERLISTPLHLDHILGLPLLSLTYQTRHSHTHGNGWGWPGHLVILRRVSVHKRATARSLMAGGGGIQGQEGDSRVGLAVWCLNTLI